MVKYGRGAGIQMTPKHRFYDDNGRFIHPPQVVIMSNLLMKAFTFIGVVSIYLLVLFFLAAVFTTAIYEAL